MELVMKPQQEITFCVSNDLHFDRRMIRICTSLSQCGYRVLLIGRKKKDSPELGVHNFEQVRHRLMFEKGILFYAELNIRLFWYLIRRRPEIIGSVDLDTVPACWLAAKFIQKPIVFDAHEWFEETPELSDYPLKRKIWKLLGNFFIPKCDHHITVSDSLAKRFFTLYQKEFIPIRNIHPQFTITKAQKPANKILVYVGVLNQGRGLPELIEAMDHLPDHILWILGEGDLIAQLQRQARQGQSFSRIKFFGWVKPERLSQIMSHCWLGIHLLDPLSQSYTYSLSNKFFDYVHSFLPQLVSDLPEYRNLVSEYQVGYLLKQLTIDEIVTQIQSISNNQEAYQSCVEQCKEAVKVWNWDLEKKKLGLIFPLCDNL